MKRQRPHIKLNTQRQNERLVREFKFNYGFGDQDDGIDKKEKNYEDFLKRLEGNLLHLKALGVNYRPLE